MTPPRRWSGLLNLGFEWSNFCPSPAQTCSLSSERGDVWTELGTGVFKGDELPDGLYQVEFVGRRTLKAGHFGHLNQYDHYMIVDRIVSVKRVGKGGYQ